MLATLTAEPEVGTCTAANQMFVNNRETLLNKDLTKLLGQASDDETMMFGCFLGDDGSYGGNN